MDNTQDANSQSDEQDLEITVPDPDVEAEGEDSSQDQEGKEDPSDKLTEDHPRFKQVLDRAKTAEEERDALRQELEDTKSSISARQEATGDDDLTPEEQASLEKIEKNLAKRGFVRQEDLRVTQNATTLKTLGEKYNGSDDLPKFDRTEVVAHAKQNGFGDNYEAAYRDLHFDAIVEKEAKARNKAPNSPTGEKPTGGEQKGPTKRFTEADIEAMSPEEYSKYREGLLTAIKPK